MAMQFQPKGEDELKKFDLLQPADYAFEVLAAEHATSKKTGAAMIKLKLGVYRENGSQQFVWDYLVGAMEAKLRHFCDTTGLLPRYQSGSLTPEDCVGRSGTLKLVIKHDKTGQYDDKNEVKDYVCRPAKPIVTAQSAAAAKSDQPEDDVPF